MVNFVYEYNYFAVFVEIIQVRRPKKGAKGADFGDGTDRIFAVFDSSRKFTNSLGAPGTEISEVW